MKSKTETRFNRNSFLQRHFKQAMLFFLVLGLVGLGNTALADIPTFTIAIKNHLFYPDHLQVPAKQRVKLIIKNEDGTPEEFESFELNREKVIMGNTQAIVFIGPLAPGEYPFFGEFYPETAQGKITAK